MTDAVLQSSEHEVSRFRLAVKLLPLCVVVVLWLAGCATTTPAEPTAPAPSDAEIYAQAQALYEHGEYQQALKLIGPLAQRGEARAQYIVGYMYFYGQGVQRNERVAYAWIGNAARQGYPPALEAVRNIRAKQDEATRQAQESVEDTKPYPPPVEQTPALVLPPQSEDSDVIDLRPRATAPPPPVLPEVPAAMLAEPVQPAPTAPQTERLPPSTESADDAEPAQASQYRDSAWVMGQPADVYTIQLLSGTSRDDALTFMNTHDLELEVALFDYIRGGVQWYAVLYGAFPTLPQARAAMQQLSPELLAKEPWIRPMESIHALRASP